jgi:uncharacterized membrane protein YccC
MSVDTKETTMYDHTSPTNTLALSAAWLVFSASQTAAQAHVLRLHEDANCDHLVRLARSARPTAAGPDGATPVRGPRAAFRRAASATPRAIRTLPRALRLRHSAAASDPAARSLDLRSSDDCVTC